jgi:hypothetical protein
VTEGTFEELTLGTLAVIVMIGLIGYAFAGEVRAQQAEVPLELEVPGGWLPPERRGPRHGSPRQLAKLMLSAGRAIEQTTTRFAGRESVCDVIPAMAHRMAASPS